MQTPIADSSQNLSKSDFQTPATGPKSEALPPSSKRLDSAMSGPSTAGKMNWQDRLGKFVSMMVSQLSSISFVPLGAVLQNLLSSGQKPQVVATESAALKLNFTLTYNAEPEGENGLEDFEFRRQVETNTRHSASVISDDATAQTGSSAENLSKKKKLESHNKVRFAPPPEKTAESNRTTNPNVQIDKDKRPVIGPEVDLAKAESWDMDDFEAWKNKKYPGQ